MNNGYNRYTQEPSGWMLNLTPQASHKYDTVEEGQSAENGSLSWQQTVCCRDNGQRQAPAGAATRDFDEQLHTPKPPEPQHFIIGDEEGNGPFTIAMKRDRLTAANGTTTVLVCTPASLPVATVHPPSPRKAPASQKQTQQPLPTSSTAPALPPPRRSQQHPPPSKADQHQGDDGKVDGGDVVTSVGGNLADLPPRLAEVLPGGYEYLLVSLRDETPRGEGCPPPFRATVRVKDVDCKEAALRWLLQFERSSRLRYTVRKSWRENTARVVFKKIFKCMHNTGAGFPASKTKTPHAKHTKCEANITCTVKNKKMTRSSDTLLASHPFQVSLNYVHNHPLGLAATLARGRRRRRQGGGAGKKGKVDAVGAGDHEGDVGAEVAAAALPLAPASSPPPPPTSSPPAPPTSSLATLCAVVHLGEGLSVAGGEGGLTYTAAPAVTAVPSSSPALPPPPPVPPSTLTLSPEEVAVCRAELFSAVEQVCQRLDSPGGGGAVALSGSLRVLAARLRAAAAAPDAAASVAQILASPPPPPASLPPPTSRPG